MVDRQTTELVFRSWSGNLDRRRQSLWFDQAQIASREITTLAGDRSADVCIIGGGFTGLWTAIRLKEADPGLDVVVLESDRCGAGASGRNSGGVGHWWTKLPMLERLMGPERALRFVSASVEAVDIIDEYVKAHDIDCAARHDATMLAAVNMSQVGTWEPMFRIADRMGVESPYRRLDKYEIKSKLGEGPYLEGIIDDHAMRIQPALLVRGLKERAESLGCAIYERTAVTGIAAGPHKISARCAAGTVTTQKLVLACYAWMAHLPEFRDRVAVVRSDIAATDPIPERLAALGLSNRPNVMTGGQQPNYGGVTQDGRVYTGRGAGALAYDARITAHFDGEPSSLESVGRDFRFLYPDLADVPVTTTWSGPIDMTAAGLPWFDRLAADDRIFYGIGYTGHGVGASALGGHILSAKVLERQHPLDDLAETLAMMRGGGTYPPEPARYIGGRMVKAAVGRKEKALRNGQQPARIDRWLAGMATPALKPVSAVRSGPEG